MYVCKCKCNRVWKDFFFICFAEQMKEIKKTSLARVLCDNAQGVNSMQKDVFRAESSTNKLQECSHPNIPSMDLSMWAEH